MSPKETSEVISLIRSTFPGRPFGPEAADAMAAAIRPLPVEPVRQAIIAHARRSVFPPAIAEVWGPVRDAALGLPSPEEAWDQVIDRVRSTTLGQPAPVWTAPPLVRATLKAIGGTYALRTTDNEARLRERFIRAYRTGRDAELDRIDTGLASGRYQIEPGPGGELALIERTTAPATSLLSPGMSN